MRRVATLGVPIDSKEHLQDVSYITDRKVCMKTTVIMTHDGVVDSDEPTRSRWVSRRQFETLRRPAV